jgi:HrpA-like RNA helicase
VVQNVRGYGTNLDNAIEYYVINGVLVCVLYAALPPKMQMIAFQPRPRGCNRKVILCTNIAETSITVEGIKYVVDSGKHKMREFSGVTGIESLILADISKAQVRCHAYAKPDGLFID